MPTKKETRRALALRIALACVPEGEQVTPALETALGHRIGEQPGEYDLLCKTVELRDRLRKLPPVCAARDNVTREPIVIVRGESGYYSPKPGFEPNSFNAALGVTPQQREAMVVGSMFGWDVPAANPERAAFARANNCC